MARRREKAGGIAARFRQINRFVDGIGAALQDPTAIAVWVVLWRHADKKRFVRLSAPRIAASVGVSEATARRKILRLLENGMISRHETRSGQSAAYVMTSLPDPRRLKWALERAADTPDEGDFES